MSLLRFTLTFTGTVNTDGGKRDAAFIGLTEGELIANLGDTVSHVVANGFLTGDSPATLDSHEHSIRVVATSWPVDSKNLSSVVEEVDAMDWQFSELARLITDLETQPSASSRACMAKVARRHLDTLVQRAFRAKQVAGGLLVHKAN
jgi:hypothetical protein